MDITHNLNKTGQRGLTRKNKNKTVIKLFVCLHGDKIYNSFVCGNTT